MKKRESNLKKDLKKYYIIDTGKSKPSLFSKLRIFLFNFGLHCVLVYRFVKLSERIYEKTKIVGILFRLISNIFKLYINFFYHVEIFSASFGPGLYIGHVGTIYIGKTKVGANCSINHNVTIGYGQSKDKIGIPEVGDNVWIGTGSVITGKIIIENNVTIGPGSILSKDIPSGSYVCGNPARVIIRDYDNSSLFGVED